MLRTKNSVEDFHSVIQSCYKYASLYLETDTSLKEERNFSKKWKHVMPDEETNQQASKKKKSIMLWKENFEDKCLGTVCKIK